MESSFSRAPAAKAAQRSAEEPAPSDVLRSALAVYSFPFFATPELAHFVASVAAEGFPQPQLFLLSADRDQLRPGHLLARVPVYYGRPVASMYKDDALKRLTSYSTGEALAVKGPVFAIGGRTPVFGRPGQFVTVLHGWGLNFEGTSTHDYLRFVRGGALNAADARREMHRRVWLWASAAASFADGEHKAQWALPAIGFGAFLGALPARSSSEPLLRCAFVDALAHAASALQTKLVIELRDHGGLFLADAAALSAAGVVYSHGANGDLFRDPGRAVDRQGNILVGDSARLVLMNAWDDRRVLTLSFIGNGGSQDPTIDGWMVAGSGPNKSLRNASYLFNPFISRSLLEPGNWRVVDEPQ